MINLFKVQSPTINTGKYSNLLHDPIKTEVEEKIADYAGAKYAVAVKSCTDAIFLSLKSLGKNVTCTVPSLSTTRFMNAIVYAGCNYEFTDNTTWVGHEYMLYESDSTSIIDSAQRLDKNQFCNECKADDLLLFSNYPTKPLGGLQGGFVVSDNEDKINWIRQASYFGESFHKDSWKGKSNFIGWQMYMNSVEADFVNFALKGYEKKRQRLDDIREMYISEFQHYVMTPDSYHLFRMYVKDNRKFMDSMLGKGIITGIHYAPAHLNPVYNYGKDWACTESEYAGKQIASIPFHDGLTNNEVKTVIKAIKEYFRKHKI
jgi:dTDP-4-amino-4,6-dideoxygalactose transaminase